MNNDFYQIAISDPDCQALDFLQAIKNDPTLAAVMKQSKQLNQQLSSTFSQLEPSEAFSKKLHGFCNESPVELNKPQSEKKTKAYPMIALAASFFVAAISFTLWKTNFNHHNNLSVHALSHSAHAEYFAKISNEIPSLQSVNYRLKDFGNQLSHHLDNLVWFKNCTFEGVDSLHLVLNGKQGRVNVYVIPKNQEFSIDKQFNSKNYHGVAKELGNAYLLIVGENDERLQPYQQQLSNALISI